MSVLDELVATARERASALPPFAHDGSPRDRGSFARAIAGRDRLSVVAEFKRRSPSEGGIAGGAAVVEQLRVYVEAGASAASVLTEPSRFGGSSDDLRDAAGAVPLPILMKDFVVDERQVQHAAELGASAVLLIVRCLAGRQLDDLAATCAAFGLDALVECHDEAELDRALEVEGAIVGINNRDLDSLVVDTSRAPALLRRVPKDRIAIAESGYSRAEDVRTVRGLADAVLVGTSLMRSADPRVFIREAAR